MPHPAFAETGHRPYPLPTSAWTWRQSWRDLLFAHWPVPSELLRPLIPPELEVEECEGSAWLGVVPFRMTGVMRRYLPDVPGVSAFPELNVRTYVRAGGKPGVWFFSLDATKALAVWAARTFFYLPYYHANIHCTPEGSGIRYALERKQDRTVGFAGHYAPSSSIYRAPAGGLEHFLTERYCLYTLSPQGQLLRNDVHHAPWPLQKAEAEITSCTMGRPHGLELPDSPPLLHFAKQIDVVVYDAVVVTPEPRPARQ